MNPATSTPKSTLKQKLSNGFVLFTAIWSSVIVPITPSYAKMLHPDELPTLGSDSVPIDDNKTEQFLAEYSQNAAHFISDKKGAKDLAEMAQDYARSKLTHTATDEVNRWLSKAGNAKFSVDVDKKLSIKNTQLDGLVPWYDQPDLLLFSQHNIHRTDGRLQANNGIGVRRFTPERMMGVNAFFDHDLSRYHSRLGFGAEYAQDFLKLSANTYLRTSPWRSAPELDNDYNARPANGWDLQAEGWLPSYPNIGGNIKFEQYFGDDVALFGKDKRQNDPLSTTVGVNWTPFSLITLNAEHKISGRLSETSAKVQFTWALGKSLAEQLDPTKVGDSRRLMGNRYDFVNRNNNIVLEYQKKTLISLSLPAKIQGQAGDELPIINALTSKYPLDNLVVQAPEFLSAGGKINLNGAATQVKLPSYKVAMTEQEQQKINLYRLTVTASDTKGNISPQATTLIEVTNSGVLTIRQNEITQKGNALANGQDVNTLTIVARDPLGNVAPNANVTFTLPAELKLVTQKATSSSMAFSNLFKKMQAAKSTTKQKYDIVTNMKGEASIQFTSVTTGEHRIQAAAGKGTPIESVFIFIADTQQAHINAFNIISDNAVADGKAKNKINFHITDDNNHPIKGAMLHLDARNATVTQVNPSDEQGNTEVDVSTLIAGSTNITASLNEQNVTATVNFVFGQLAHVVITDISQAAAGDDSTITISLADAHGNPVSGADGTVMVNINGTETPVAIAETHPGSGVYIGTLPGQQMGKPTVTVTVDGQVSPSETMIVEPPKPISPVNPNGTGQKGEQGVIDSVIITPNKSHGLQSGDTLELTVTITDAFNNGLPGLNTNNINIGDHKGDSLHWTDNKDGSYTTTLPLTEVGEKDLTASVNGTISPQTQIQVENATGTINVDKVEITDITKPTAGMDSTLTVTLTDKHGNPVVGEKDIIVNIGGQDHKLPVAEVSPGIYEAIITGQHTGGHDISVTVNGEESKKETLVVKPATPVSPKNPNGAGNKGELGVVNKIDIKTGNTVGLQSGDNIDITVTLTDAFGNGLKDLNIKNINIGNHKDETLIWVDNGDGSYTTTLPLTQIGNNDLTASMNGITSQQTQIQVNNPAGKDKVSKVEITNIETPAAGTESTLTITLTDKHDNLVVGEKHIIINIDGTPHKLPVSEISDGIYNVVIPGQQAGNHDITATVNNQNSAQKTLNVDKTKPISPINKNGNGNKGEKGVINKIEMITGNTANLHSGDKLEVTVTLTDAFGNTLKDIDTSNITLDGHKAGSLTWVDNGDGSYSTNITLTDIGSNNLTASINGHKTPTAQVQVGNATGTDKVSKIEILTIETPPAGTDSNLTIKLTDKYGNLVVGEKEITVNINGQDHKLPVTEKPAGIYQAIITGQHSGNHDISVTVNGEESKKETLVVKPATPVSPKNPNGTGNKGELGVVDKIDIKTGNTIGLQSADNIDITVTLTDAFGNGLKDLNIKDINIGNHKGDTLTWADNGDGSYSTNIVLTEVGDKELTASMNGIASQQTQIKIHNATGKDKVSKVDIIQIEKPTAGSNSTLTVELTDKHGNPVIGEQEMVIEIDGKIHTLPAKETKPGIYEVVIPGQQAGKHDITVTVNSQSTPQKTLNVDKAKPISPIDKSGNGNKGEKGVVDKIEIATGNTANLHSGDKLEVIVTLTDAFGNGLIDIGTTNITLDGHKAGSLTWVDNGDGSYSTNITLTDIGSNDLTASINGHKTPPVQVQVSNAKGQDKVSKIEILTIETPPAGTEGNLTIKLTDKYGNLVVGETEMTVNIEGKPHKLVATEKTDGIYEVTLPAQQAGKHNISVSVNGKNSTDTTLVVKKPTPIKPNSTGKPGEKGVVNSIAMITGNTDNLQSGDQLEISVSITDAFGNGLTALDAGNIKLDGYNGTLVWNDKGDGTYTATITLAETGSKNLIASINGNKAQIKPIQINPAKGTDKVSKVDIIQTEKPAAGADSILTVELTDKHGNPVIGEQEMVIEIDGKIHTLPAKETKPGIYEVVIPGQQAGKHDITVTVNSQSTPQKTLNVDKAKPISPIDKSGNGNKGEKGVVDKIEIATGNTANLHSGDKLEVIVTLTDAFGNGLIDIDTTNITLDGYKASSLKWVDKGNGTYTTSLLLTQTGSNDLSASINGYKSQLIPITVSNTTDINKVARIELEPIFPSEAGESQTITVKVTDKYQHPVTTIASDIAVKLTGSTIPINLMESNIKGSYSATLSAQNKGEYTVEAKANTKATSKIWTVKAATTISAAAKDGSGTKDQRGVVKTAVLTSSSTSDLKSGQSLQLTVTLKDAFGNALEGINDASIQLKHQQPKVNSIIWKDLRNGDYTTLLPLTKIGKDTLNATVNKITSLSTEIDVGNAAGVTQISHVEIKDIKALAAGEKSTITLVLTDKNKLPVTNANGNVVISIDGSEQLLKIAETNNKGTYTGTLSGQKVGDHKVIVTVGSVKSIESTLAVNPPTSIAINNGGKSGSRGVVNRATLAVSPNKNLKSGKILKLTATLVDAFDNPLTGVDLAQLLTHKQAGQVAWAAQQDGAYTANLVLTQLGQDHLFITANKIQSATVVIDVKPQLGSNAIHKIDINNITKVAAGADSTFTVKLTDDMGNTVADINEVTVTIDQQQPSKITVTQQKDGSYTGTLLGQQSGPHDVVISANNHNSVKSILNVAAPDTVFATPNGGGATETRGVVNDVTLTVTPNTNVKSGDNLQLTITLNDKFSNPLKGVINPNITLQHSQAVKVKWTDLNNGNYAATLPLKVLGKDTLKATVNQKNSSEININVMNTNQATQVDKVIIGTIIASAAGETSTLTVKAQDSHGHGVTQITDDIKVTINDAPADIKFTETSIKGNYSATLPASKAGNYTIKVTTNKLTEQQTWTVNAPISTNATQSDGSGTKETLGVVKTVELIATPTQDLKSGGSITLTVTLKDTFDNPLTGINPTKIALTHNQKNTVTWTSKQDGSYTANLLLKTLGKDNLFASINNENSLPISIMVEKTEGNSNVKQVEIINITQPAAGADSTFTVKLTDDMGNTVADINEVTVTIDQQQPSKIAVTQQTDGSYIGTLLGQQSGPHDVVVTANSQASTPKQLQVVAPDTVLATQNGGGTQGARGVVDSVALSTKPSTDFKSGDNLQLTITLKDKFSNPLKGVTSANITLLHKQKSSVTWTDNNNGSYTAILLLKELGSDPLKVTVNSVNSTPVNITVVNTDQITQVKTINLDSIATSAAGQAQIITVKAKDSHDHGVTQIADDIKVMLDNTPENVTFVESKVDKGTYRATLAAKSEGNYTVNVTANKKEIQQKWEVKAATTIKAAQADGSGVQGASGVVKTVELAVSPTKGFKSGNTVNLTVTLKDAFSNTLTGIALDKITLTHSQTGNVTWAEQKNGTYTADLVLKILGKDNLVATANKIPSQASQIEVATQSDSTTIKKVDIIDITPAAAGADSSFTVALTDKNGHPVIGIKNVEVTIGQQSATTIALIQQIDKSYIGKLPGQLSGSHPIIVTVNSQSSTPKKLQVAAPDTVLATQNGGGTQGARGVVDSVALSTKPSTDFKSGDNLQLTITLKDKFSNPLKGVTSANITLLHKQKSSVTWTDNNNGSYTATLPLKMLGSDTLKATVNSKQSAPVTIIVKNANQATQVNKVIVDTITASAAGETGVISIKIEDANQHGVAQITDDIKVTINDTPTNIKFTETNTKGIYTATLPAKSKGNYTVKVTANKKEMQQSWVVKAATIVKATKTDGSGAQDTLGVVKTVELIATPTQNLKSGDTVNLTITLKDAFDNTLTGIAPDKITLTHNQKGKATWTEQNNGTYTASLLLDTLGNKELNATVNNISSQTLRILVEKAVGNSKVTQINILSIFEPMAGAESTLAVSLADSNGHSVEGIKEVTVKISNNIILVIPVSPLPNGNYIGTLPGQQQGTYDLVVSVKNSNSAAKSWTVKKPSTLVAINANGSGDQNKRGVVAKMLFTAIPTADLKAGDKLKLTVTLKDYFDNTLRGIESKSIVINHKQSSSVVWKDNADGTYTTELLLTKLAKDTLTVTINSVSKEENIEVGSPEGQSAVQNVKLEVTNTKLSVNDPVELQLTLTDSHGNGVEKVQTRDIQLEHNNTLASKLAWAEKGAGIYTATLPLHKQGKNTFVSRVNHQENTPLAINVSALTGSTHVQSVELKTSSNQLTVGSKTELSLTLTDQWNNGVEGITAKDIVINDAHTKRELSSLTWTAQGNGIYITPITLSMAGIHSLRATANQQQSKNVLIEVKPSTDSSQVHKVTLTATPNVITAGDNVTLSLKVTDADDNPVINLNNSDIRTTGIPNKGPTVWKEDSHGLGLYTTTIMFSEVKTHSIVAGIGRFTDTTDITVNSPMGKDAVKHIEISPITESDAGQSASLSISLIDGHKNPVKNVSSGDITIKINGKEQRIVFMEKNRLNKYIAQLPASKAGGYKITVEVNGQSETVNWNVKAPTDIPIASYDKDGLRGSLDTLFITHSAKSNTLNSAEKVTLTVSLKDKFGNKLTGASSNLTLLTDLQSAATWKELSGGLYNQELTMNKLRKQAIQVAADKILSDKLELTVNPATGANNVHKTTLSTDEGTLEAGKEVLLTLALTDSVNNGVINVDASDIQLTNNGNSANVKWANPQDGVYTTQQRLETVGNYQFIATVNKKPSRIQTVEATYPSGKDVVKTAEMTTNTNAFDAGKKVELTLTLKDQYGNLVTGVTGADVVLKDSHAVETIDSSRIAWNMESAGVYKATLPLTKVGKHRITATVNNQNAKTTEITVNTLKGVSNVKEITLATANTSMNAGESTILTLTMLDNYGNEVADVAPKDIQFKNIDNTIITKALWMKTASHDNVYTAQITLEKVNKHTLSVDVNGQVKNIDIEVKPLEGVNNVAKVELNSPATAKVGVDTPLTLQLKDRFGNGVINVANQDIQLTHNGKEKSITWTEDSNGQYTTNWQSTKVGKHLLDVVVNTNRLIKPIEIEFMAPQGAKSVEVIHINTLDTAEAGDTVKVTLQLRDKNDNGVIDISASDITLSSDKQTLSSLVWSDDKLGNYSTNVKFDTEGKHTLMVIINNPAKITEKKEINIQVGAPIFGRWKSEFYVDTDSVEGNGKARAMIILKLTNKNGVLISGKKPKITSSSGVLSNAVMKEIEASGVYTASVSSSKAEKVMVTLDSNSIGHVGTEQEIDIYFYSFQDIGYPITSVIDQQYFHFYSKIKDYTDYTWENSHPDLIDFGTKLVPYIKNKPNRQKNVIKLIARPNKNSHKLEAIRATITINTYFYASNDRMDSEHKVNVDRECLNNGDSIADESKLFMLYQNPQRFIDTFHDAHMNIGYWTLQNTALFKNGLITFNYGPALSIKIRTLCMANF